MGRPWRGGKCGHQCQHAFKLLGRLFLYQFYSDHRPIIDIGAINEPIIGRWFGAINHVTIKVTIRLTIAHDETRTRNTTPKEAPCKQTRC